MACICLLQSAPNDTSPDQPATDELDALPLAPDGAETLGGLAETVHESTVQKLPETDTGQEVLGITYLEWSLGIGALLLALIVRFILLLLIRRTVSLWEQRTRRRLNQRAIGALNSAVGFLVLILGFFLCFSFISLPSAPIDWQAGVWRLLYSLAAIGGGWLLFRFVELLLEGLSGEDEDVKRSLLDQRFVPLLRDMARWLLIVLVVITVVQGWGYSAASILAGVGIGGLAIAFAAQDTVANIFGSFVVYTDRPYRVGDWVEIGGVMGIVEEIGVRSTRIRTFDKCLVSIPNKTVSAEKIFNWSAMTHRRIRWHINVAYNTPPDLMERLLAELREIVGQHEETAEDMWLVYLEALGSHSLDILVQVYLNVTGYSDFLKSQEALILKIIRKFEALGVAFAFPTVTQYLRTEAPLMVRESKPDTDRLG